MDGKSAKSNIKPYGEYEYSLLPKNDEIDYVSKRYMPLVAAILEQAEFDLKSRIISGDTKGANNLRKWFLSDWGQALSGDHGKQ